MPRNNCTDRTVVNSLYIYHETTISRAINQLVEQADSSLDQPLLFGQHLEGGLL